MPATFRINRLRQARNAFSAPIPGKTLPARRPATLLRRREAVEAQFPFPFEILDLAYAIPGDTQAGEPAISTLATLFENQRSPF